MTKCCKYAIIINNNKETIMAKPKEKLYAIRIKPAVKGYVGTVEYITTDKKGNDNYREEKHLLNEAEDAHSFLDDVL